MKTGMNHIPLLVMVGLIVMVGTTFCGNDNESWLEQRKAMILSIAADVGLHGDDLGSESLSLDVMRAMARVPRHLFVPERLRSFAYNNNPLPIGHGQTISQPTIVAMMTHLMSVTAKDTVLEIGTGSGYQAAVLAELVAHVHTIEIVPELAQSARDILADLEYTNVTVYTGDGYAGLPECAPFQAIMVTAAPPILPVALLDQLMPGGKLVAPVGPHGGTQWLTVWTKLDDGTCHKQVVIPVRFVPMVKEAAH